jgi:hypothetical protein
MSRDDTLQGQNGRNVYVSNQTFCASMGDNLVKQVLNRVIPGWANGTGIQDERVKQLLFDCQHGGIKPLMRTGACWLRSTSRTCSRITAAR